MKRLARTLLPVGVRLALRRLAGDVTRYSGPYATWQAAMADATGYSADVIARRVLHAARQVADGRAAYEQDSVLFDAPSAPERLLRVLALAREGASAPVSVLDFGGSLGSLYYRARPFLASGEVSSWTVCEQPAFVRLGHEFEDGVLRFVDDPARAGHSNVLILSSVLPYLEEPIRILEGLARLGPDWILIDRTPLSPDADWHLFDQHVPASIYRAAYPVWLIPGRSIETALHGYSLVDQSELADETLSAGGIHAPYRWMIWRRQSLVPA